MYVDPPTGGLRRRNARHQAAADRYPGNVVRDPRGGVTSVERIEARRDEVHHRIDKEEAESEKHRRISPGRRLLCRLLPVLDGLVLCWFLTGVLNADLRTFDVTVVIAAVLAVLGSIAVAAWNGGVGEHLQRWKDSDRNLEWGAVDGIGYAMLVATAVMWALLAWMMYVRVSDEVYQATGVAGTAATVIGLTLAAAIVLVNAYVLISRFQDGSTLTQELADLGRVLAPEMRRRNRHQRLADDAGHRAEARVAAHRRLAAPSPVNEPLALPSGSRGRLLRTRAATRSVAGVSPGRRSDRRGAIPLSAPRDPA